MTDSYDDGYDQAPEAAPRDGSGRHPVNVGHLVMGVAFLCLTGVWALFASGAIGSEDLRWFMPIPWLVAGVAGLLAIVLPGRRRAARSRGGR